jgi:glucose-1-phosphate thymidylyltransferase
MAARFENIIGLLPAAGRATRVAPLPVSKELFPVGFGDIEGLPGPRPKVAAHYLLERMRLAGAGKAYIVLRRGKWDIPAYFGDGQQFGMHLAYLIMGRPFGVPYTLDQAYPFISSATILFGFPDIVFFPQDVYVRLLQSLDSADADLALGVFKAQRTEKMDMVELDSQDRILRIDIKPRQTRLTQTWITAAWRPAFTEFMHGFVARHAGSHTPHGNAWGAAEPAELYMGDVIRASMAAGMGISVVCFNNGRYLDIGTPEDIATATDFVAAVEDTSGGGRSPPGPWKGGCYGGHSKEGKK